MTVGLGRGGVRLDQASSACAFRIIRHRPGDDHGILRVDHGVPRPAFSPSALLAESAIEEANDDPPSCQRANNRRKRASVRAPEKLEEEYDIQDIEEDARGERNRLVRTGMTQGSPRRYRFRRPLGRLATRSCMRPGCARISAQSRPGAAPAARRTRTGRGTTDRAAPRTRLTR